ncbi:MAG: hypothetical protein HYT80_11205 [Euryarchaeota archaeon]|nr:hypothetical protein [Euryarchaeota archaeon]
MAELAPVFVNASRVSLGGEPKPKVSKIVKAAGKNPETVHVRRLRDKNDAEGTPVQLAEVIDRTQETNPVFLKCIEEAKARQAPGALGGPPPPNTVPDEQPSIQQATPPARGPEPAPPPMPEPSPEPTRPKEENP